MRTRRNQEPWLLALGERKVGDPRAVSDAVQLVAIVDDLSRALTPARGPLVVIRSQRGASGVATHTYLTMFSGRPFKLLGVHATHDVAMATVPTARTTPQVEVIDDAWGSSVPGADAFGFDATGPLGLKVETGFTGLSGGRIAAANVPLWFPYPIAMDLGGPLTFENVTPNAALDLSVWIEIDLTQRDHAQGF